MASRDTTSSADGQSGSVPFFNIGQGAQAAVALQQELLEAYEQTSRAWLARLRKRSRSHYRMEGPRQAREEFYPETSTFLFCPIENN
jgi:hypothetical protein